MVLKSKKEHTKTCSICKKLKPLHEFNKNYKAKDGYDYRCRSCVSNYQKQRKKNLDIYKKDLKKSRNWRFDNLEHKRKYDRDYYYNHKEERDEYDRKKSFLGKNLGTSGIGCKPRHDPLGNIDFDKEFRVIRHAKKELLKKGNGRKLSYEKISSYKKIVFNRSNFTLLARRKMWIPIKCRFCSNGMMVLPDDIHTYDYNSDGVVMPYCNNCGVVMNDL